MKTLILILLFSTAIIAQTPSPVVAVPSPSPAIETQETKEITILRAQLDTMREYNESLLNTVYWSLGTTVVVAVLLVSFSWFTNYKIYERDKAALNQELSSSIGSQILETRTKLTEELTDKLKEISTKSVDAATSKAEAIVASLNYKTESLDNSILRLKYNIKQSDARYWELKGVKANEMDRYREMLKMAIELKDDHSISTSLDGLTRMFQAGVFPFYGHIPALVTQLDSLPPKYSTEVETLKNLLKNAKIQ